MVDRREFIRRMAVSAVFLAVGSVGVLELITKLGSSTPQQLTVRQTTQTQPPPGQTSTQTTQQSSGTQQVPAGYVYLAPLNAVAGKTYAYFTHPTYGESILINYGGSWRAFSAVCTHAGCTVDFTGTSIYCPCHAASFSPTNGAVQGGPAPTRLSEYGVLVQNGGLYVSQGVIN